MKKINLQDPKVILLISQLSDQILEILIIRTTLPEAIYKAQSTQ